MVCFPAEVLLFFGLCQVLVLLVYNAFQRLSFSLFSPSLPLTPSFLLRKILHFLPAPSSIHLISLLAALAGLEHKQSNRASDSIYRCAANIPR